MRVLWLRTALRDLRSELDWIAAEDPAASRLVAARIEQAVALLGEQSEIGRPGRVAGTRELVIHRTRYVVPYRVRGDTVELLRVFHTSRRLPKRW